MSDESRQALGEGAEQRRMFLEAAGKLAMAAPAASLLLAASGRQSMAAPYSSNGGGSSGGGGGTGPTYIPPPTNGTREELQAWFDAWMRRLFGGG